MNVTCRYCGWVHMAYTRKQAEAEVAQFNAYFDSLTEQQQWDCYRGMRSRVKDYESCDLCGRQSFRPFREGDCPDGVTIGPVIYEPESAGD